MIKTNMTPDEFLTLYHKLHPHGPRVTVYDRSDTTSWKKFVPLYVALDDGTYEVGHADYVHYTLLLREDNVGRPGDN